jgi:hypothetical protein
VENVELEVLLHYARRFFVYNLKFFFVRVTDVGSENLVASLRQFRISHVLFVRRCNTGVVLVFIPGSIEPAMSGWF